MIRRFGVKKKSNVPHKRKTHQPLAFWLWVLSE